MVEEPIKNGGTVTVYVNAEWPEENQKALQEKVDALNASIEKTYDLALKVADLLRDCGIEFK